VTFVCFVAVGVVIFACFVPCPVVIFVATPVV